MKAPVTVAAAIAVLVVAPPAAFANDLTLTWTNGAGYQHQGRYTDLTDNLCARTEGQDTTVKMVPVNGIGLTHSVSAVNAGPGTFGPWNCTGNLSIPEDKQYRMEIWVAPTPGGPKTDLVKSQTFFS